MPPAGASTGHSADQPAAAYRGEHGVQARRLLLELERDRALARGGGTMVAARSRDHARGRDVAGQQVVERAARLERARVLEILQLEDEGDAVEAEVRAVHLDDGGATDMGSDPFLRRLDGRGRSGRVLHAMNLVPVAASSAHLGRLADAGWLRPTKIKQWVFYKRDEKRIAELKRALSKGL
jgi:hypothetical protein